MNFNDRLKSDPFFPGESTAEIYIQVKNSPCKRIHYTQITIQYYQIWFLHYVFLKTQSKKRHPMYEKNESEGSSTTNNTDK